MDNNTEYEICQYCGDEAILNKGFCSTNCWNGYKAETFED